MAKGFLRYLAVTVAALQFCSVVSGYAEGENRKPALFAFENGLGFGTAEEVAPALRSLGYSGVSQAKETGDDLANLIPVYEKHGLRVLSVYLDGSEKPVDPDLVRPLANRRAMIELTIHRMTPTTVDAVRKTCEMAAEMDIRVALYPHFGNGIATMPQAMDLIGKVNHPNLGVMFNLCHFLRSENPDGLEKVIAAAGDRLFSVSTAGADTHGKDWPQLIKPLGEGDFPQQRLLKVLEENHYSGPIALQCYNVPGDKHANLRASMEAWKKLTAKP